MYSFFIYNLWNIVFIWSVRHAQFFVTPWIAACQASLSFTISLSLPIELVMPSNRLILCFLLLLHPIFPCIRVFSFLMSCLFTSGGQSAGASTSASVLPMNMQSWFPLSLSWFPWCSRDSQESFPEPQFKNINSSALSLLYGPTLTSIHDYWKKHSFDYTEFCWQSDVIAFLP